MELTTKKAVLYALKEKKLSKYRLAKILGRRPIMINNYLNHTRMGKVTADKFKEEFGIHISDAYNPSQGEE